jgi:hypothetical protein
MKSHDDESAEAGSLQRHGTLVSTAWEHVVEGHKRFQEDTREKSWTGAYRESELLLRWIREYRSLTE